MPWRTETEPQRVERLRAEADGDHFAVRSRRGDAASTVRFFARREKAEAWRDEMIAGARVELPADFHHHRASVVRVDAYLETFDSGTWTRVDGSSASCICEVHFAD